MEQYSQQYRLLVIVSAPTLLQTQLWQQSPLEKDFLTHLSIHPLVVVAHSLPRKKI